jgi:ADP-ribose pyrophosphatase YjhB (NUDIX family)
MIAACMIICEDGKFLGVSRKNDHSKFGFPGGKGEKNETPKKAAIRETFEETKIIVKNCEQIFVMKAGKYEAYCFVALEWEGNPKSCEEGVVKWLNAYSLTNENAAYPEYNSKAITAYKKYLEGI